jgi:hypothetical protein
MTIPPEPDDGLNEFDSGKRDDPNEGKVGSNGRPIGPHGCCGGPADKPCNGRALSGTDRCYHHTNPHIKAKIKAGARSRELDIIVSGSIFNDTSKKASPIEALFDELARTQTIVHWLGNLLDEMAKSDPELFTSLVTKEIEEGTKPMAMKGHVGMLNVIRRQLVKTESGLNPFVLWFMKEREHLVRVSQLLMSFGIKLDEIDLSRRQGELVVQAMHNFAELLGQQVDDPAINALITDALNSIVMGG